MRNTTKLINFLKISNLLTPLKHSDTKGSKGHHRISLSPCPILNACIGIIEPIIVTKTNLKIMWGK